MQTRVPGSLQQHVVNPVVKLGWRLGIPIPGDALAERKGPMDSASLPRQCGRSPVLFSIIPNGSG
jgi:hypothetical protein